MHVRSLMKVWGSSVVVVEVAQAPISEAVDVGGGRWAGDSFEVAKS